jgi:hypothetical protein
MRMQIFAKKKLNHSEIPYKIYAMKSDKKNLENLDKTSMMIPFLKSWRPE